MKISTTTLQRIDRATLESKANRFALLVWGALWLTLALIARVVWDAWYGFTAGLILGCGVAVFLTWLFFARKSARKRHTVRASWAGTRFRIFDPIEDKTDEVDFSKPHRAILVRCKSENRFLLRIEEIKENKEDTTRINLIGPLPLANPMRVSGEAHSLLGFFKMAKSGISKGIPYLFRTEEGDGAEAAAALLQFTEEHKERRNNALHVTRGDDIIHVADGVFALEKKSERIVFNETLSITTALMATPRADSISNVHEILIALVPPSGVADALVFSIIAALEENEVFPSTWDVPEAAMHRKFSLYDDSAQSYVVALALKNYLRRIEPNNPVLAILRY